ncbi:MAG: hypothetical protein HY270_19140 [Deltaproteobacteria bacterium]|nr:hypothetical protein [Deltaproteobacteria bacterium]
MANPNEVDRFAAQRKALSTMLARFTADRDSLITAIQECQEQLASIASRIDSGSDASDQLGEVKNLVERMRQDQEQIEVARERFAEVSTMLSQLESDRDEHTATLVRCEQQLNDLLARVDALHRRSAEIDTLRQSVDEVRAERGSFEESLLARIREATEPLSTGLERLQSAVAAVPPVEAVADASEQHELVQRLASEQVAVTSALDVTQQQLKELAERVHTLLLATEQSTGGLQQQIEEIHGEHQKRQGELRESLSQAFAEIAETVGRLEKIESEYSTFAEGSHDTAARIAAVQDSFAAALAGCQEQLAALRGRFDATLAGEVGSLADLSSRLDAVVDEQRNLQESLHEGVEAAQTRARDAVDRVEQIATERFDRLADAEDAAAQLRSRQEALALEIEQTRQHVATLADEAHATRERESSHVEDLKQQIILHESAQQRLADDLRAALAQAQNVAAETAHRFEVSTLDLTNRLNGVTASVDQRLGSEGQEFIQGLSACRAQLDTLSGRVDSVESGAFPQLADLRQRVDQLATLRGELESIARDELTAAARQADASLAELRHVVDRHAQQLGEAVDHRTELDRHQGQLDEALQATQQQVVALMQQIEALHAKQYPEIEALKAHLSALHEEQHNTAEHANTTLTAAMASAQAAIQQVEVLTAAHRDNSAGVEAALADATGDRQQLHSAIQDMQLRLGELTGLFEEGSAPNQAAFAELRSEVEALRQAQIDAEAKGHALIDRATEQSLAAFQRFEAAAEAQRRTEADAEALAKLLADQEAEFQAALQASRQRISALEDAADSSKASAANATALAEEVKQLQVLSEQQRQEARLELAKVATQADEVLRRLVIVEQGLATHQVAGAVREQFEVDTTAALLHCREQLAAFGQELATQIDSRRLLVEEVQQLVEVGRQETRRNLDAVQATVESAVQKTTRLDDAVAALRHDLEAARAQSGALESAQRQLDDQAGPCREFASRTRVADAMDGRRRRAVGRRRTGARRRNPRMRKTAC